MVDAIVFEENGFPVELGTAREIERAVAAGRLRPDTLVRTQTKGGAHHIIRADEVAWLCAFLGLRDDEPATPTDAPPAVVSSALDGLSQAEAGVGRPTRSGPWQHEKSSACEPTRHSTPTNAHSTTSKQDVGLKHLDAYVDPDGTLARGLAPLLRFADFKGRSSPQEFWTFMLLMPVGLLLTVAIVEPSVAGLVSLAVIMPALAVAVRRLHDQDRTGWVLLVGLVPYIGWFVLLIFMVLPGNIGSNRFGPNPMRGNNQAL